MQFLRRILFEHFGKRGPVAVRNFDHAVLLLECRQDRGKLPQNVGNVDPGRIAEKFRHFCIKETAHKTG